MEDSLISKLIPSTGDTRRLHRKLYRRWLSDQENANLNDPHPFQLANA